MQKPLHPHRYRETMSAAIARLEDIAAGTEPLERLAIEFSGVSQAELSTRRQYLNHIERLIANWIGDGCQAFDAVAFMDELVHSECWPFVLQRDLGDRVTYVHFGQVERMVLKSQEAAFIEGFYFRKILGDEGDALEITFVCNGPVWNELEHGPYGHALRTASQIAICAIPIGSELPEALNETVLHGDDEFKSDSVISLARRVVGNIIAILHKKPDLSAMPYLGPLH
ncbi:hypothetical protein GGQ64_004998 [Rhizobium azooxidifex]|uniref:Uncharacterized protein n=1 Tax=Mycoplana azooxidifex TaxID=1636188 RepID=A0A7W6DH80_9HYPH|nr:hypothetical protein [Mycoplana azooxidifex]MBB3979753.1 hypothetical protein [Mycoplana azooxidifex]